MVMGEHGRLYMADKNGQMQLVSPISLDSYVYWPRFCDIAIDVLDPNTNVLHMIQFESIVDIYKQHEANIFVGTDIFSEISGNLFSAKLQIDQACSENGNKSRVWHSVLWYRPGMGIVEAGQTTPGLQCGEVLANMEHVRETAFRYIAQSPNLIWIMQTENAEIAKFIPFRVGTEFSHIWENVWMGVTVRNQTELDVRAASLLLTAVGVRYIDVVASGEIISLQKVLSVSGDDLEEQDKPKIGWVTIRNDYRADVDISLVRKMVEQCKESGVPVWIENLGSRPFDSISGDAYELSNGGSIVDEWPDDLKQYRQLPR